MQVKDKKTWTVIGVIVGGIVLYKVIKSIKSKATNVNPGGGTVVIPGLSSAELLRLQTMSNDLYQAFNNCGTDNVNVSKILAQVKNEEDFQNLIQVYDNRTTTCQWWCVFCSEFTGGLLDTIKNEMSDKEIVKLNNLLNTKGVTTKI